MLFSLTPLQVNSNGTDNLVFEESSFLSPPQARSSPFRPLLLFSPLSPPPLCSWKENESTKLRTWSPHKLSSILSSFHHKFSPFKLYFFVLKISTALWRSLSHTASQGPTSDQLVRHDVIRRPPWTAVTWWHWLLAENTPLARIGRRCP